MAEIESHIATLDAINPDSPTSPSDVLLAVASFNADVQQQLPESLKEWLDKLVRKVNAIVRELPEVASFSITVGSPFTVSVSVTFTRPQGDQGKLLI